jgi:hypothetical protein
MSVSAQTIHQVRPRVRLAIAATFPAHTAGPDNHDAESCAHHVPESRQDPESRQGPSAVGATPAGATGINRRHSTRDVRLLLGGPRRPLWFELAPPRSGILPRPGRPPPRHDSRALVPCSWRLYCLRTSIVVMVVIWWTMPIEATESITACDRCHCDTCESSV